MGLFLYLKAGFELVLYFKIKPHFIDFAILSDTLYNIRHRTLKTKTTNERKCILWTDYQPL